MTQKRDLFILSGKIPPRPAPVERDPQHTGFAVGAWPVYDSLYGKHGASLYQGIEEDPTCPDPITEAYLNAWDDRLSGRPGTITEQTPAVQGLISEAAQAVEEVDADELERAAARRGDRVLPVAVVPGGTVEVDGELLGYAIRFIPAGTVVGSYDPKTGLWETNPHLVSPDPIPPESETPRSAPWAPQGAPEEPVEELGQPEAPDAPDANVGAHGRTWPFVTGIPEESIDSAARILAGAQRQFRDALANLLATWQAMEDARFECLVQLMIPGTANEFPKGKSHADAERNYKQETAITEAPPKKPQDTLLASVLRLGFHPSDELLADLACGKTVQVRTVAGQLCEVWVNSRGAHVTPLEPANDGSDGMAPADNAAKLMEIFDGIHFTRKAVRDEAEALLAQHGHYAVLAALGEERDRKGRVTIGIVRKAAQILSS